MMNDALEYTWAEGKIESSSMPPLSHRWLLSLNLIDRCDNPPPRRSAGLALGSARRNQILITYLCGTINNT